MCCSPAAMKDVAREFPVTLDEASKDEVKNVATAPRHRFGRLSLASSSPRPLAVRRPASALRPAAAAGPRHSTHTQTRRVSREDLDCVRVALEQELAAGGPLSDADIHRQPSFFGEVSSAGRLSR